MTHKEEAAVLTKQDMVLVLVEKLGLTHRKALSHVDAFMESFSELLATGNHLKISYLGDFILQDKPSRPGRNPKTGKNHEICARRVVKFHPAAKLRAVVKSL